MTHPLTPREAPDYIPDGFWIDCWNCDGGSYADCHEEYACIDPESGCEWCLRICDVCKGKGGWYADEPEESQS